MPYLNAAVLLLNIVLAVLLLKGLEKVSDTQVTEGQVAGELAQDALDLKQLLADKQAIIAKDDADLAALKANPGDPAALASLLQTHQMLRSLLDAVVPAGTAPASTTTGATGV